MQALSKAEAGGDYTIKWMFGAPEVLDFLHTRHVKEGTTVHIIHQYRDSVLIGVEDMRFVLGNEVADRIQV